ncbi:hypothetical protein [uncultured Variovorax sp.]|jgi:hypothetical protein|uniref:hypothetical protein n=1 Tax=uncultured Variovorax sp. TaxID=114708 RepID=UPI002614B5B8|nr:hypothetical protein [uncultured Variovorax sp.]
MRTIKPLISFALASAAWLANAQGMPPALMSANAASHSDWAQAAPLLRAAIECIANLPATPPVRAVFRTTNDVLSGDHALPAPLTVFGSLKVTSISVFAGDEGEGGSYTIKPEGATLAQAATAANLKRAGQRYIRRVRGGIIEASEPHPGEVQIACIRGGDAQ